MAYLYILKSKSNARYYIGSTTDLARRLREHDAGNTPTTRHSGPGQLVYNEEFGALAEARRRERG
jgi:predicted GIY-YIG superfamily endonuclease